MRGRRGRRRWIRGAAMAEMLLGVPFMILLYVGVDYFRKGYARRLDTLNQSHAEAWQKAYSNDGSCFAGGGPWTGFTNNSGQMPTDSSGESLDKKFDSSMFMYGVAHAPKSMAVTNSRWHATASSNTTITCNEVVPEEDRNVFKPLIDFIRSML
jgi:hypothetical protein